MSEQTSLTRRQTCIKLFTAIEGTSTDRVEIAREMENSIFTSTSSTPMYFEALSRCLYALERNPNPRLWLARNGTPIDLSHVADYAFYDLPGSEDIDRLYAQYEEIINQETVEISTYQDSTLYKCHKCGSDMQMRQMHNRRADEEQAIHIRCLKCGNKGKV